MNLTKKKILLLPSLFVILLWFQYSYISNFLIVHQNEFLRWQYSVFNGATTITYDHQGEIELKSSLFYPKKEGENMLLPTIIYLFGGGWKKGGIDQFYKHAMYFRNKGYLTVLVDYRVKIRHVSTPLESIKDVKSILYYLNRHSTELKIDTNKIYIIGASAGGQLALAASFFDSECNSTPNVTIKGIMLYSPVVDCSIDGYYFIGLDTLLARQLSPMSNIKKKMPPTLIFHGENDPLISPETVLKYQLLTQGAENYCKVIILKNLAHKIPENGQFTQSILDCESFMNKHL